MNQTLEEVCLKEDLCRLWSPHFLLTPCVNIFVADDCPYRHKQVVNRGTSDRDKQVHH